MDKMAEFIGKFLCGCFIMVLLPWVIAALIELVLDVYEAIGPWLWIILIGGVLFAIFV